ncbi:MAG TPA: NUDIX hydrolase [Deltaproteobacteria bacterium]|nr:NUDIX hydrolase [Deltaproteobacteria bacterium]
MSELDERSFLQAYDPSAFDRPSLAVDLAVLTVDDGVLRALLVQRGEHPFRGGWALPGGFVQIDESLSAAARRVLRQKAGLEGVFTEQLYTFGDPGRDPRMRIVSVAYYALLDAGQLGEPQPGRRFLEVVVPWEGETGGPVQPVDRDHQPLPLAFDHADILGMAVRRIRGKLDYTPIGFQLLPETFTLRELQRVHETVLGTSLNKDSFRRRMLASGQLEATGEREQQVGHRPAELYRFARRSAI